MTAVSGTSEKVTRRAVQLEANFERIAYLGMRMSGIVLLVLAVGHMMIQHVLNSSTNLTIQFVAEQWRSWGWKSYDMLLLIFAFSHGINGLRNVLSDYIHNDKIMKGINVFLAVFLVVTILWAGFAIARFDPAAIQ
ncbi:MAG: succinate dehydrogenase [Chloroflexi bacterium]|nr:MAG: succinate dehydrogenase [Chloroflexota bacterium]